MRFFKQSLLIFLSILGPNLSFAQGSGLSIGASVGHSQSIYRDTSTDSVWLPAIFYTGEHLYFHGAELGYSFLPIRSSPLNFSVMARYHGQSFDPSDSSNAQMQRLDEREASLLAGGKISATTQVGSFSASVAFDINEEYDGHLIGLHWGLPSITIEEWLVQLSFAYLYNDKKMADYYYGVSAAEAARTTFAQYQPDSAGQTSVAIRFSRELTSQLSLSLGGRYTQFNNQVSNSPIVSDDSILSGNVTLIYTF